MKTDLRHHAAALALCLAASGLAIIPARADPDGMAIRPADAVRLAEADAAFGRGMRKALAEGAADDIDALAEALSGAPGRLDPVGEWSCRTMKLGRVSPLLVYSAFRCRIEPAGPDRWRLEKLTGSQRMAGTIAEGEGAALYTGVGYVDGGPATDYAGLPPDDQSAVEPGQTVAQVGIFEQMGPDRARLLLPKPILESEYDILYLTR